jgi:ABC-2 type transport system ATP-binding protein
MANELAIEAVGLRKSYGSVEALRGVDLRVEPGRVYGLLGPNGAGKTTIVRILTTLLPPDGGQARVAGHDVLTDGKRVREHIGLAGQYAAVDENLTGFENLEMVGILYHLGRRVSRERADALLASFELADAGGRLVRTYSGGMRRRLDLAAALVARPPVLFLDEPTTGLDIRSRIGLWEAIEALVAEGTTVLLTTQYLDEADRLAERIAVIDHGLLIAEGTSDELKARIGGDRLEVRLDDSADADAALVALSQMGDCRPSSENGTVRILLRRERGEIAEAVRRLDDAGVGIADIGVLRPTLDDVFLTLTGHTAEPSEEEEPVAEAAAR